MSMDAKCDRSAVHMFSILSLLQTRAHTKDPEEVHDGRGCAAGCCEKDRALSGKRLFLADKYCEDVLTQCSVCHGPVDYSSIAER